MATTKNALKGTSAPLHQDAPVTSGVVDRNGTVIIGCTYCKWPAKCVDSNHDEKKTWLILGKKCIIVFRNVGVGPGVWRTIMFISQLQDWFDLITFLIRFQLKEVCEYASNWYQVYIYIYTKCQADLSFPKSVKDSRHFYCYYRFFLKSLWNKVRSTVPLAFLNANLPMVFRFRLVQRLVFRTKISGLQTSKCSRWSFLSNNPAATPPKRKN